MASELIRPETVTFLDTMLRDSANFRVEDIPVGPSHVGKTIKECDVLASASVLVVAVKHQGDYTFNPKPLTKLFADDTLIVIGDPEHVHEVTNVLGR